MEYTWLMLVQVVFVFVNPGSFKTIDTSDELDCDVRELVTCGNDMGYYSWEFCRARTKNVKKIRSVHLDIRYPNRLCRSYGTPKNFGLTEPGDSMWVIKSCYGTFLLCLELDATSTTGLPSTTTLLYMLDRKESFGNKRDTISTTRKSIDRKQNHRISQTYDRGENTSMIDEALRDISHLEEMIEENEGLDFTTKVLIIAAITAAGLCLICLVSTVSCFTIIRRSHFNPNTPDEDDIDPEETTVTSIQGLDPSEENIYNVIPCDEQNTCTNTEYKTVPPPTNEEKKQTETLPEADLHIYATTRQISRDIGNAPCVPVITENEYDRLRNVPRVSVSDSKTYNRLSDFTKESQTYSQREIPK